MVVERLGNLLVGTEAERLSYVTTNLLTHTRFYETDTERTARWDGSAWIFPEFIHDFAYAYTVYLAGSIAKARDNRTGKVIARSDGGSTVQAVFEAAFTAGTTGNSVFVTDGTYDLSAAFAGFTPFRDYAHTVMSKRATLRVPFGYTGFVFKVIPNVSAHKHGVMIDGGVLNEQGATSVNWTGIIFEAINADFGITSSTVRNVHVKNAAKGLELKTDSTGWINGNLFDNFYIERYRQAIKFNKVGGTTGVNRNTFSNSVLQASPTSGLHTHGIQDIAGNDNLFLGIKVWDFDGTGRTCNITSAGRYTKILGGIMRYWNYEDLGINTFVLDEFNSDTTRYPPGYMEVGGGVATNKITQIGSSTDLLFEANSQDPSFNVSVIPNSPTGSVSVSLYDSTFKERLFWQKLGNTQYNLDIVKQTASGALLPFKLRSLDIPNAFAIQEFLVADPVNNAVEISRTAGMKLGFFGKAPVIRGAANANTTGATLSALETEVNELKQLLRDYGLLPP